MNASTLPVFLEYLIAALIVIAGLLSLIGAIGLLRFKSFYQRLHAPSLGATMGITVLGIASLLYFNFSGQAVGFQEILIIVFLLFTVPLTALIVTRAALYRHRRAGRDVPGRDNLRGGSAENLHERLVTGDDIDEEYDPRESC